MSTFWFKGRERTVKFRNEESKRIIGLSRLDEGMEREMVRILTENFGREYSDLLGIRLVGAEDEEVFKWFLASVLFGAPIAEGSVIKTYKCFEKRGVITPRKILETGWHGLVEILDEGTYTRYDFKTSDKLLEVMNKLVAEYDGSLNLIHERASDSSDLERRLKNLGKGIGKVTISIFLRELRGIWSKADPEPTPLVILAAKNLGIIKSESPREALRELKEFWSENGVSDKTFVNFETALLRVGKDLCRRRKCGRCLLKRNCLADTSI
jgi:endonuclease III